MDFVFWTHGVLGMIFIPLPLPPPWHTHIYTYREGQSIQQILWCVVLVLQELSKGETHVARVRCVAWSPDSSRFVTAALDSNVILWDDVNESYKSRPSIKGELNMLKFSGFDDCCVGKIVHSVKLEERESFLFLVRLDIDCEYSFYAEVFQFSAVSTLCNQASILIKHASILHMFG